MLLKLKENTKYHDHLFNAKRVVDEIQPWFDFGTGKPWDDPDYPWVIDNKVRREILIMLSKGPKTLEEIQKKTNFSPKALLIEPNLYTPTVRYQWTEKTIRNHLMNLEWYNLIKSTDDNYELTFPIFDNQENSQLEDYALKFSENWIKIVLNMKKEFQKSFINFDKNPQLLEIIIDKAVNKLYELLKENKMLPDESNLKALWAEQIRTIKFEDWVKENF